MAALKGNIEAVEVLLRKSTKTSVKVDAKNELSKTPTHLAASEGHAMYVINVVLMNGSLVSLILQCD